MSTLYHYTESGLDNIYLAPSGFEYVDKPSGRTVKIKDIDGLHRAIGQVLIEQKKNLTGKELRFLRQEMVLSQATLAKLLDVTEQTVHRWENGKTDVPKPAEALIRFLYAEHSKEGDYSVKLKERLQRLADLENEIDGHRMTVDFVEDEWQLAAA